MKTTRTKFALELYIVVVSLAGAAGLVWETERVTMTSVEPWTLALYILLAGLMDLMVVPLAGGGSAAASYAAFFAGLLVLGPALTAWVAALTGIFSEGIVRRRPLSRVSFNVSHSVLSLLATGWLYQVLGGQTGHIELPPHPAGLAVMAAAVMLWLLETGWISLAVALERGGRMWQKLRASLPPMLGLDGALASAGLLLALLYQSRKEFVGEFGLGEISFAVVALVPSVLLYYAYRLQGHLHQVYAQSLRTLGALLEAKVGSLEPGHGERVGALAATLGQALDLPPNEVEQVRYAGYLHDIGKVGVPAAVLHRTPDYLSEEPRVLRHHPQLGAQIIAPIHFLRPAAEILHAHHERWDGLGYPDGLRATSIPLGARLLSLANAYVRITAYKGCTADQALYRLRQASGSRYDPMLVDTLEKVLHESGEISETKIESERSSLSFRAAPLSFQTLRHRSG